MGARFPWVMMALGVAALSVRGAMAAPALDEGVRLDALQPASPESAFIRAEGPHLPFSEGVEFAAGAGFEYAKGALKEVGVDKAGGRTMLATLVDHAILARISGSISPIHWLSFDVSLPFALFEAGDVPAPYVQRAPHPASAPGIGDLRLGVHFRPIDKASFGLILGGRFWAPFGSPDAYLSDRRFRGEVDIGVAGQVSRFLYGCTLSASPLFFAQRNGDRFATSCAAHYALGDVATIGVEPSFALVSHTNPDDKASLGVIVEPLGALRLRFGGVRLGVAAGPGFGGGMGAAELRALLTFAYVGLGKAPKPPPAAPADRDLDKIPDSVDACPDEAGPPSRDPKQNGCPSKDRDGDGIRDAEDSCPDKAGIPHEEAKANGCPDADNDGLPDPIDACVNEPGPAASGGCPKLAHLQPGGFRIEPGIDFGIGDKLSASGRAALEEVAATLRANPTLDKASFWLGTKGSQKGMAEKRAQAILVVLRAANLDPARYELVLRDDLKGGLVQVRLPK